MIAGVADMGVADMGGLSKVSLYACTLLKVAWGMFGTELTLIACLEAPL